MARAIALLLVTIAFAGCMADEPAALELTLSDVPVYAAVGEPITFTMDGEGDLAAAHVGAHFWSTSTDDPTGDFDAAGGCAHVPDGASFPATVDVTCTFAETGMVYLRGHVRSDDNVDNYWSSERTIDVRAYDLSTDAQDTTQVAIGAPVEFTLTMAGPSGTSTHAGGHYFTDDVDDPTASFDDQAGACAHATEPVAVPGTTTVRCTFDTAGTYYVFGHMRLGTQANFWADSFQVVVG